MGLYRNQNTKSVTLVILNEYFHRFGVYFALEHFDFNVQSCLDKGVSVHSVLDITNNNHLEINLIIIL